MASKNNDDSAPRKSGKKKSTQKDALSWFPHDSNAHRDPKIVALISVYTIAGYGRYFLILELLREQRDYKLSITNKYWLSTLAIYLQFTLDEAKTFIYDLVTEFELLQQDDEFLWSPAQCRRMAFWDERKRVLSERARRGAEVTNAKRAAQAKENVGTSEKNLAKDNNKKTEQILITPSSESLFLLVKGQQMDFFALKTLFEADNGLRRRWKESGFDDVPMETGLNDFLAFKHAKTYPSYKEVRDNFFNWIPSFSKKKLRENENNTNGRRKTNGNDSAASTSKGAGIVALQALKRGAAG